MRIALLAPAGAMHRYNGSFSVLLHYAPLTLVTIASLIPEDFAAQISIYDESAEKIPLDLDADLVCITAITGTALRAYAYADYFRSKGKTVVLGGVHPTLMPDEAALHADAVITGFSEYSFPQLLFDYKLGKMKKRYTQQADFDLVNKPMPRKELLKRRKYITMNSIEAIRGCAHPCTFCAYPAAFGKQLYKRPVAEVIAEIEQFSSREVLFPDVNLLADKKYAEELFTAMIPLKKIWLGLVTSAVGIDEPMIQLFQKSGCRGLLIGFESISQSSQQFIHKGINKVLEYDVLMKKLHDAGILVQGCFAFGGDEEDTSVFEKTVEMVIKCKIDLPRYSILTPFPNTQLYNQLEKDGRIIERNWALYDVEHSVFQPLQMTKEELEQGIEWAWKETYTYANIFKRLSPFTTSPYISLPTNIGYRKYASKFGKYNHEVMTDNSDIPLIS